MKRYILAIALLCAPLAYGQGTRYDNFVLKPLAAGGVTPVSGALITVCTAAGTGTPCTPKVANIYSDETLTTTISGTGGAGTTNSDANGNFGFYLAPGSYVYTITGSGITSSTVKITLPCNISNCNSLSVGGGITTWAGSDIGAQLNSAYAALPSTGGTIYLLPQTGGGCYNYSTPIVFNTVGKYVQLKGFLTNSSGVGGACLNFTTITNTCVSTGLAQGGSSACYAMELDYTPTSGGGYAPNGLEEITLTNNSCVTNGGCGSTAFGIDIGQTNGGAHSALFKNVKLSGFGTGVRYHDVNGISWGTQWLNSSIVWNTTGMNVFAPMENLMITGGRIAVNGTGITTGGGEFYVYSVSFDSNTVVAYTTTAANGASNAQFFGCHFENLGANAGLPYVTGAQNFTFIGGSLNDDCVSAAACGGITPTSYISQTGNNLNVWGTQVQTAGRGVSAGIVNTAGSFVRGVVQFYNNSPAVLGTYIGGSSSKFVSNLSSHGSNAVNPITWTIEGPLAIGGTTGGLNTPVTITAPATGGSAFTNTLQGVNDTFVYRGTADTFTGVKSFAAGTLLPSAVNTTDVGSTALPFLNLWLGTAATNNLKFQPAAMAAARVLTVPDPLGAVTMPYVIASGTTTLTANAALAAVTSQAANTTAATNTLTTDSIEWSYASAPTAGDSLCHISPYVTAGNVNFVRTNPTAAAQNVSAIVINWRVIR